MFSTRVRPKRRMKGKRIVKREREKREPQRKSLGFHIQLRVYSNGSRAHFEGKLTSLSVSLRRPKERASETQTGEDRGFFCLFSFLFCFLFSLYIRTDRDVLSIEKRAFVRWGKTLIDCVSRGALCVLSCCFRVSLSFSACVYISRERERVLFLVFQSRFYRVSRSLSVSVLFLVVHVCSRRIERERINWGHHGEDEREQETQRKSRSHLSFLC